MLEDVRSNTVGALRPQAPAKELTGAPLNPLSGLCPEPHGGIPNAPRPLRFALWAQE